MRIDKWVEFTPMCDLCNIRGSNLHDGIIHNTRGESARFAKNKGWKVVNGTTICPNCLNKRIK